VLGGLAGLFSLADGHGLDQLGPATPARMRGRVTLSLPATRSASHPSPRRP
jgi:hypothetical protein